MYKPKPTTPSSCCNDRQADVTGMNSALAKLHPLILRGIVCFIQAGYEDTFCFVECMKQRGIDMFAQRVGGLNFTEVEIEHGFQGDELLPRQRLSKQLTLGKSTVT